MKEATKKDLAGRKIVKVYLRTFKDGRGGFASDPSLLLDNGSLVTFVVQETDVGEYGVKLEISSAPSTRLKMDSSIVKRKNER